jgi:hypothetical protein
MTTITFTPENPRLSPPHYRAVAREVKAVSSSRPNSPRCAHGPTLTASSCGL